MDFYKKIPNRFCEYTQDLACIGAIIGSATAMKTPIRESFRIGKIRSGKQSIRLKKN